jgi:hypothetical protein
MKPLLPLALLAASLPAHAAQPDLLPVRQIGAVGVPGAPGGDKDAACGAEKARGKARIRDVSGH